MDHLLERVCWDVFVGTCLTRLVSVSGSFYGIEACCNGPSQLESAVGLVRESMTHCYHIIDRWGVGVAVG